MSGKGKAGSREAEIEKCREEANWKKVVELSEDMKRRVPSSEALANFLIAESQLEQFVADHGVCEQDQQLARVELSAAKHLFISTSSADSGHKEMSIDSNLLLAKLYLVTGDCSASLECLMRAGLDSLSRRQLPTRSLRVVAESFAVKGACLEKMPPKLSTKCSASQHQESVISCYEQACHLSLLYVQELDKSGGSWQSTWSVQTAGSSSSPLPPVSEGRLGPLLDSAIVRLLELLRRSGQWLRLISKLRSILSAAESSATVTVRLNVTRQLACLLLSTVSERAYSVLQTAIATDNNNSLSSVSSRHPLSPWKPRRQASSNSFSPKDINEEVILLLLIGEALAVREAVLTQTPESAAARESSCLAAESVYDLMTVTLIRHGQAVMVCESLERALRFSFQREHVWRLYCLCLCAADQWQRGLLVAARAVDLCSSSADSVTLALVAARVCYQYLHRYDEGLEWSERALQLSSADIPLATNTPAPCSDTLSQADSTFSFSSSSCCSSSSSLMKGRCHLYIGIGHMLLTSSSQQRQHRQQRAADALTNFRRCAELDCGGDHLVDFYLAYQLCLDRKLPAAADHLQRALRSRPDHVQSVHLLALLLSAQNKHRRALQLLEAALEEFPDNLQLMYVLTHLQEYCNGPEVALSVARGMLQQWRCQFDSCSGQQRAPSSPASSSSTRLFSANTSDIDTGSVCAASTVARSVMGEPPLSEMDSSLKSGLAHHTTDQMYSVQLQLWLLIANLFLKLDQVGEAISCVQEAISIAPSSHLIEYVKGLVEEQRGDYESAKRHFTDALAIDPSHVTSLQHLGLIHHYLGSHKLAEKVLRDAIQQEPLLHGAWYNLGKVLEHMTEYEAAAECFMTAIDIEASAPILPFTTVAICFE